MSGSPPSTEHLLQLLSKNIEQITALTVDLTDTQLHVAPVPEEWSLNEILAHLRSCADVWGGCIDRILAEDHPTIKAINPTTWIEQTDCREQTFRASVQLHAAQRTRLLTTLESLPAESWERSAKVTGAGKALERSVAFYAEWLARHERSHLKPIERTIRGVRAE